jgi:type 1 fimbria pilin
MVFSKNIYRVKCVLYKRIHLFIGILIILGCYSNKVFCAIDHGFLDINIHGELYAPMCKINNGADIDVDYGTIKVDSLDNDQDIIPLDYNIQCEGVSTNNSVSITASGDAAGFDTDKATVKTNEFANLGVKVYIDNKPMVLGNKYSVKLSTLPVVAVQLLKQKNTTVTSGDFSAKIILTATYN